MKDFVSIFWHHTLENTPEMRREILRLQGIQPTKKTYVDLQQFAAILLPPESAIFYPDGNLRGKTLENGGQRVSRPTAKTSKS